MVGLQIQIRERDRNLYPSSLANMHRGLMFCAVAVLVLTIAAAPAAAEPSGPTVPTAPSGTPPKNERSCAIATALIPTATSVAGGSAANSEEQARVLRNLARKRSTPRRVERALERIADWFEAAPDRSVGERGLRLAALQQQVAIVITWGGKVCGEPIATATTTSTTSQRFVPNVGS
jgi:hypothetical protein